jgi:RHS repeat-associated protein
VVQRRQSCFTSLAARPLSADRSGCLAFLVALLWLCGALPAHALRSPLPPPDRAAIQTSPVETRIGDFSFTASGRLSLDREPGAEIAAGCDACAYETASGQRQWLNQDPIGEAGGINLYRFALNSPINWVDTDGLQPVNVAVTPRVTPRNTPNYGVITEEVLESLRHNRTYRASPEQLFNERALRNARDRELSQRFPGHKPGNTYLTAAPQPPQKPTPCPPNSLSDRNAPPKFFIEGGVRRSVASREAGESQIPAIIYREGQSPERTSVNLDQLYSPKDSIPLDARFLRIQPPIVVPIELQPLGAPGQPPSIPIRDVRIE